MYMLNHWFFKGREEGILRCFERLDKRGGGILDVQGRSVWSQCIEHCDTMTPSMESAAWKTAGSQVDRTPACRLLGRDTTGMRRELGGIAARACRQVNPDSGTDGHRARTHQRHGDSRVSQRCICSGTSRHRQGIPRDGSGRAWR